MDLSIIIVGLVEIVLALLFGALFIFGAFKLFILLTKDMNEMEEIKKNNTAVGILMGAMILSIVIVCINSLESAITVLGIALRSPESTWLTYLKFSGIMLAHMLLSSIIAFFGVYFGIRLFMWMTRDINEMDEIRKNNIAVAVIIGVIVVSMAMLLAPGIKTLLDGLIPFPPAAVNVG
jgi:uncharacterized membrane protein YjfL (UPF0719 family)